MRLFRAPRATLDDPPTPTPHTATAAPAGPTAPTGRALMPWMKRATATIMWAIGRGGWGKGETRRGHQTHTHTHALFLPTPPPHTHKPSSVTATPTPTPPPSPRSVSKPSARATARSSKRCSPGKRTKRRWRTCHPTGARWQKTSSRPCRRNVQRLRWRAFFCLTKRRRRPRRMMVATRTCRAGEMDGALIIFFFGLVMIHYFWRALGREKNGFVVALKLKKKQVIAPPARRPAWPPGRPAGHADRRPQPALVRGQSRSDQSRAVV